VSTSQNGELAAATPSYPFDRFLEKQLWVNLRIAYSSHLDVPEVRGHTWKSANGEVGRGRCLELGSGFLSGL
jgi:hypothetical protein